MVTNSVLLEDECPLCTQTKAALVQLGFGVVYPVLVSPLAGFYYAFTYGTCNIPPPRRAHVGELFQIWLSMTRKLGNRLTLAIIVNGLAASVLTYFEADSFYKVKQKLYEREEKFRSDMYGKHSKSN